MQAHLEILIIGTIFLGIDVGNVEVEGTDQFQNTGYTSGNILKTEFEEDPLLKTLTVNERYLWAMKTLHDRLKV